MPTVAINGLGRIGRAALKILLDSDGLELAAVNDIAAADNLAYLLNYDTVYGRYHRKVSAEDGALVVDDRRIPVFAERDPGVLPWGDLGIDLVLECTGVFTTEEDLRRHIRAALLNLARRCRRRIAKWSRFPSRRLSEVLKAINPGIADGVQGPWWRTPV